MRFERKEGNTLYNRYIPNGSVYTRVSMEDLPPPPKPRVSDSAAKPEEEKKSTGLAGILKSLKLDDLDTGDILLLLIMLFLFLEGDDMELVITLGLILILSL